MLSILKAFEESCQVNNVLEIGPGRGVLTEGLYFNQQRRLFLSETDERLYPYLRSTYPKALLIEGDFLKQDWNKIFQEPFAVIGNFPYNISSQIIFKVLEMREKIPLVVGMFQKEVADRIAGSSGSKDYGILSVLTQAYYEVTDVVLVGRENFTPPPKVESKVILMKKKEEDPGVSFRALKEVVKQAFNQRRKRLSNALKALMSAKGAASIPFADKRAEQLSLADFIELTKALNL